jgi:tetratricopeptide (TPR) repeat protein
MSQLINEIASHVKEGKVTFMVGPAISSFAPSNLPVPHQITSAMLETFYKHSKVLKEQFTNYDGFASALDTIVYEKLLQILGDNTGSLDILGVFHMGTPNIIHHFLAKCLAEGNHVISTCIDNLMEDACSINNQNVKIYLANNDMEKALEEVESGKVSSVLFKLRGSIKQPESLCVTAEQIGQSGVGFAVDEKKGAFFGKLAGDKHLVVLGYPNTKDMDIIPHLIYLKSRWKIYWLQDQKIDGFQVATEEEINKDEKWKAIAANRKMELIYGDTLAFTKTLWEKVLGGLPDDTNEIGTETLDYHGLHVQLMEGMVKEWIKDQKGLLELISGLMLYEGNHRKEALASFETAERFFNESGDQRAAARALTNLSVLYADQMDHKKASDALAECEKIYRDVNDTQGLATTIRNKASLDLADGLWEEALKQFQESRDHYKKCDDKQGIAAVTSAMAQICTDMGHYEKARNLFFVCNTTYKEIGDMNGYGMSLANSGRLLYAQNHLEEAEFLFRIALYILTPSDDLESISKISNNLGSLYGKLGRIEDAEKSFQMAVEAGEKIGDKTIEMDVLLNKGTMLLHLGKQKEALKALNEGLEMAKKLNAPVRLGQAQGNIGLALLDSNKAHKSLEFFNDAMETFKKIGAEIEVAFSHENIGDAYRGCGKLENADSHYNQSIKLLEKMRGNFIDESIKLSFQHHIENTYNRVIDLYHEQGRDTESYNYAERSRSRAFVDILAATNVTPANTLPKGFLDLEEEYLSQLRRIYAGRISTRDIDTDNLHRKQLDLYKEIEKIDPEYAYFRRGNPLHFKEVQACLISH